MRALQVMHHAVSARGIPQLCNGASPPVLLGVLGCISSASACRTAGGEGRDAFRGFDVDRLGLPSFGAVHGCHTGPSSASSR
jgi:hypothetical protein